MQDLFLLFFLLFKKYHSLTFSSYLSIDLKNSYQLNKLIFVGLKYKF